MQISQLPPPYNQIQMRTAGKVLGEMVNMRGKQNRTIIHRLKKAKKHGVGRGAPKKSYFETKESQKNYESNYGMR